jgi:hypothetical protein
LLGDDLNIRFLRHCQNRQLPQHGQRLAQSKLSWSQQHEGVTMNAVLSPLVSEFETQEQEDSYVAWVKAKLQASLDDPRPNVPHDQVMAKARALLESKREERVDH